MESITETLLFASTSANIYNFLGRNDPDNNFLLYQKIIGVDEKAHYDLMNFRIEHVKIVDPYDSLSVKIGPKPITITFHSGSYNMLLAYFLYMGQKVHILSDNRSVGLRDYHDARGHYERRYKNGCDGIMLNVQENGFIFRAIKKIRDGFPVTAFIDGNKGIDGLTGENENLLEIPFGHGRVRVRKGLAYLAYLTGVPLVLALSYQRGDELCLQAFESIEPIAEESREQFCERALLKVYSIFEQHVKEHTADWASWPYVHNWSNLRAFKDSSPEVSESKSYIDLTDDWVFDVGRFLPLRVDKDFYLFDKTRYKAIKIDTEDVGLFSRRTSQVEKRALFNSLLGSDPARFEEYVKQDIFIHKKLVYG